MSPGPSIVWFRRDLRLEDNEALHHASERGPVVPIFILTEEDESGPFAAGAATRWWLHHSLEALADSIAAIGGKLLLRRGNALEVLRTLARETGATAVTWNRTYEPRLIARDSVIKAALREDGLEVSSHNSSLLAEPHTIANKTGEPYKVFTPFWKTLSALPIPEPTPPVMKLRQAAKQANSLALDALGLLPTIDWAAGLRAAWKPGEKSALAQANYFLDERVDVYPEQRDFPAVDATSRLSPALHFGEIGPRQLWQLAHENAAAAPWLRQLAWREFAHHLLFHFPRTVDEPLRPEFEAFPWNFDEDKLRAWQRGRTGYPIVDAGMRELWTTGIMHNRVRMIVASFLVKDLLIPWQEGAAWFRDTLVDADLANNTLGWQWTAGCGADAAPYFRVFNPVSQGRKFDAEGSYVRRWLPELASLPNEFIHAPWEAPEDVLREADVALGKNYPRPMVDHAKARDAALAAYAIIKGRG